MSQGLGRLQRALLKVIDDDGAITAPGIFWRWYGLTYPTHLDHRYEGIRQALWRLHKRGLVRYDVEDQADGYPAIVWRRAVMGSTEDSPF